jgi:hypothetical protein
MGVQGATADLIIWQNNVTAVALEHSYGRFVHISEEERHHTAIEQPDSGAALTDSRENRRHDVKEFVGYRGQHGVHLTKLFRQEWLYKVLHSGVLVETQQSEHKAQSSGIGQQARENQVQQRPGERRTGRPESFTHGFGNVPISDARRACGFTGATEETKIHMLFESIAQLDPSFCGGFDEMNAPAR